MTVCRIRIVGLACGTPTAFDGLWLKEYDPGRDGVDPEGNRMHAHIVCTEVADEAAKFPTAGDAHRTWAAVDPRKPFRRDGEANRPLTAFTVEVL